ncbi:HEAT repeat domain-containing protein [Nannocystis bainbridge]|uniref:HEAT repeat domain-containing protein n=1 Tax=Nannocystis bainbridge TaxID=2995303 RepID=A0ABT5DPE7_9BACT|nr:HEAT repeat domain-containing protein [Nannocystis bainbridge]MDC0715522.1 HEAT repeat domain-containing protein [Nannocystis bainbridge]
MPSAALALVLALAPAAASTGTLGQAAWDSAAMSARDMVDRAGLVRPGQKTRGELVAAAGLSRADVVRVLGDMFTACGGAACPALQSDEPARILLDTLGEIGVLADAPLLLRLDAVSIYQAERSLEAILTRAMADAIPKARCAPPTRSELATARLALADFAVLRRHGDVLQGDAPTPAELDDLAYFFAAVADTGPEVGRTREAGGARKPAAPDPESDRLAAAVADAKTRGDVAGLVQHGRAYLARLGFPGPLDSSAETHWAWGGARYSYVFRDLALGAELLGDPTLAGELYRRANPGGGMCGTSVSYRWSEQVRGAIRSAERTGDCRVAMAERLLDVDGPRDMYPKPAPASIDYGPARLAEAGFDVARLYRGAILTAGRDGEPAEVRAALERAPEPLRSAALARLARRGPEAWEARVHALEGLADVVGRPAVAELERMLPLLADGPRQRALEAIGELADRPAWDPCDPDEAGIYFSSYSSQWSRHVTSLGDSCDTVLRLHEAGPLALSLTAWLADANPDTREAAAAALGKIGHRAALPALRASKRDRFYPDDSKRCDDGNCHIYFPVREAAAEAIVAIRERSVHDARWRRNDAHR